MKKLQFILFTCFMSWQMAFGQKIVSEETMFLNDEPNSVLLSSTYRSFFSNKLVDAYTHYPSTSAKTENHIAVGTNLYRLCNGTPGEYENVIVYGKLEGVNDTIVIDTFDLVKGFKSIIAELPFAVSSQDFVTKNGATISLANTFGTPVELFLECNDVVFKKLQTIKHQAFLKFTQYNLNNNNWSVTDPRRSRHFLTALANLNYVTSQDEFESIFLNYRGLLHGGGRVLVLEDSLGRYHRAASLNKNKIDLSPDSIFIYDPTIHLLLDTMEVNKNTKTKAGFNVDSLYPNSQIVRIINLSQIIDRPDFLRRLYARPRHNLGFTGGLANGLGGGTTLGIRGGAFDANRTYETPTKAPDPWKSSAGNLIGTYAHEMGHVLGYPHGSNMTYAIKRGSWTDIMQVSFEAYSNGGKTIDGDFFYDGIDLQIDDTLPFLNPIYIQDIVYTPALDFGTAIHSLYKEAFITIKNHDFKSAENTNSRTTEMTITGIDFPEGISAPGVNFPIKLISRDSINIPILINVKNTSSVDTLHYEENVRIHSRNTLDIPVSAVVVPAVIQSYDTVAVCEEYYWNTRSVPLRGNGNYIDTLSNINGQDSIVALHLIIQKTVDTTTLVKSENCSYTWPINGNTYYLSGTYYEVLVNSFGCDSVVALHLEVYQNKDSVSLLSGEDDMVEITSNDSIINIGTLRLGVEKNKLGQVLSGLRFDNVNIPTGAVITSARIVFTARQDASTIVNFKVAGEKAINSQVFDIAEDGNISQRVKTSSSTLWNAQPNWEKNNSYETSNLKDIMQEIIDQKGWNQGNPVTFIIESNIGSERLRETYSGSGSKVRRPRLVFSYVMPSEKVSACQPYYWPETNETYTTSGIYSNNITGAGCDSIKLLNLTIDNVIRETDAQTACDAYTWTNGITYTRSNNTATDTFVSATGCDSIVTLNLTIEPIDVSLTTNSPTITSNNTEASYQWLDCDNNYSMIQGETSRTIITNSNGTYSVEVRENGCIDTSSCITIANVSVGKNPLFDQVTIYPNPNQGQVNIDLGELRNVSVKVFNLTGKVIYEDQDINTPNYKLEIKEVAGVYLIEISSNNESQKYKLIVR